MSHLLFHLTIICSQEFGGEESLLEQMCALDLKWSQGHDGRRNEV